jgi:cellulose synthase/poly-beta-1,6-N-acetylglucosamine synthase-like glycosyltransferase
MEGIHFIGTIIYFAMLVGLSCYGLHRYLMIYLYYKHRNQTPEPAGQLNPLPRVTVQLPLFNEMYVAERLLDAIAALDYPREKLEIQVLDDSTDETVEIVARKVKALRSQGFDIAYIHRTNRKGFKAGALENGLQKTTTEFIAIFDADFVPQPDLLKKTIHYFSDPKVGLIQTRWGHLNEPYSLLTRIQSILLDAHFLIEQTARSHSGRFFNFNGTAGVWRRSCIQSAGGWQHDTLAEDLDLSYRAQIKGWKFLFLPHVVTPAELPVEMNAFKTQQHRWAKGSAQAMKKMLPKVWRAKLPLKIKLEATMHLTSNLGHLMLFVLCLLFRYSAYAGAHEATGGNEWTKLFLVDIPLFLAASLSVTAFYLCPQFELHEKWWKRLLYMPLMMAVGIGLCINNARAVLEAIFNHQTEFIRTPKIGERTKLELRTGNKYRTLRGLFPYIEIGFGFYFSYLLAEAIILEHWTMLPFVSLFVVGFFYVGLLSLVQTSPRLFRRPQPTLTPANV